MMMNKLHMLALVGLMFSGVNNASVMGQEQMEVLYTLDALEQDPAQVPMIVQNIDMFMGVTEMNIQLKEINVKTVTKELKAALWKNAALLGGIILTQHISGMILYNIRDGYLVTSPSEIDLLHQTSLIVQDNFALNNLLGLGLVGKVFAALNIHGAWKKRSELMQALALDKEILSKLQEIKDSIDSSMPADNSMSADNFLLESAA